MLWGFRGRVTAPGPASQILVLAPCAVLSRSWLPLVCILDGRFGSLGSS
jgi:hypothetical protein